MFALHKVGNTTLYSFQFNSLPQLKHKLLQF